MNENDLPPSFGDPFIAGSPAALLSKTLASSRRGIDSSHHKLDPVQLLLKSMEPNEQEKLMEQMKAILGNNVSTSSKKLFEDTGFQDLHCNATSKQRKLRPSLGHERSHFRAAWNESHDLQIGRQSILEDLEDPEEYFSALDDIEFAEKESKRLKGEVAVQQITGRKNRTGLNFQRRASYKHIYPQSESNKEGTERASCLAAEVTNGLNGSGEITGGAEFDASNASVTELEDRIKHSFDAMLNDFRGVDKDPELSLKQKNLEMTVFEKLKLPASSILKGEFGTTKEVLLKAGQTFSRFPSASENADILGFSMGKVQSHTQSSVINPSSLLHELGNQTSQPHTPIALTSTSPIKKSASVDGAKRNASRSQIDFGEDWLGSWAQNVARSSAEKIGSRTNLTHNFEILRKGKGDVSDATDEDRIGARSSLKEDNTSSGRSLKNLSSERDLMGSTFKENNMVNFSSHSHMLPIATSSFNVMNEISVRSSEEKNAGTTSEKCLLQDSDEPLKMMEPVGEMRTTGTLIQSEEHIASSGGNIPTDQMSESQHVIDKQIIENLADISAKSSQGMKSKAPLRKARPTRKARDRFSLADAGCAWQNGVRRSTRIRSRPLHWWKGERFLYGRIHNSLTTVIGVKKDISADGQGEHYTVESFVSEEYQDLVDWAASY